MIETLNLKLVTMQEYQNIKIFLENVTLQIGVKNFLIKKVKDLFYGHMLLLILMEKKLLECFMKKNCKKQIKQSLELKR